MTQVDTRARVAGSLLALLLAACGSEETSQKRDVETVPPTPKLLNFQANPTEIGAGETTTLEWSTQDAVSFSINDGAGQPVPVDGLDPKEGTVAVSPSETTTYTLIANGAPGSRGPAYGSVTVTVRAATGDAPVIEVFEASAAEVRVGEELTLSWRTAHATAVTLKDDAGTTIDLGGAAPGSGSVAVRPTRAPTVYSLVATGGGQRATAEVSVDVVGLPRVQRFAVEPIEPVAVGATVRLVWETARAERVVIADDAGATVVDTTEATGGHELRLDRTTTFELTATGNGTETKAQVLARVGARLLDFTASPRVARAGDPIVLTWRTADAESLVITGPGAFRHEVPAAELAAGTTTTALPGTGDYVLAARLGTVVQTWSIFVEATEAPRIRSLVASTGRVTAAPDQPALVTLTYVQDGATSCSLLRNGVVVPQFNGFLCGATGSLDVEISGDTDLRLVAVNHAGNHQSTVHVDAVPPARIEAFTKTPARRLSPGGTVELAWEVVDAVSVRLDKDGASLGIGATEFVGTRTDVVLLDGVYTLTAENSLGDEATAALTVRAGAPVIETFAAAPAVIVPGDDVTFRWTCDGGDTLVLADAEGVEKAAVTAPASIDAGTATFAAPAVPGTYTYTLRVANDAAQEDVATVELLVTDGPLVRSLTASTRKLSLGSPVTLAWNVTQDAAGATPALALVDDQGGTYDLTGKTTADSLAVTPATQGTYVFTLTASTPGTRPSSAQVTVEVSAAPKIVTFTSTPDVVHTAGATGAQGLELAWTTENGAELAIWEADPSGQPIPPALFRRSLATGATQAELDASSVQLQASGTVRYLLRLTNSIGSSTQKVVTVLFDPPRVDSFTADVVDLIKGESTTVRWETTNATMAMLQPPVPTVTALPVDPTRFVDISTLPGAEQLAMVANDTYQTVNFPPDFRFPFDGKLHTGMRIISNGYLSFDLASTGTSSSNTKFITSSTYRYAHIAPFWDYLAAYANGTVYWRFDDVARTVTVMWKNYSYRTTSATFDLNIAVVLHENGSFEFRYGKMDAANTSTTDYTDEARGSSATIGYQDLAGASGWVVSHSTEIAGGLAHKGYRFDFNTAVDSLQEVAPAANQTYVLTAANADTMVTRNVDVRVWPVPVVDVVSLYPSGPQAGMPFLVSWRTSNSTRVRLLDAQGAVLCEESDPARVAVGSCERTETTPGNRQYTLEVINGIERNATLRPVVFTVFPRLSIDLFAASKTFVANGEAVTLTWEGHGGFEAQLLECVPKTNRTNCVSINITGQDPNHGSYTTTMTASKEYLFRLVDRLYRAEEATANVWVNIPTIGGFTASTRQTIPNENVTLEWNSTGSTATLTNYAIPAPREVASPYADIAALPGTVEVARTGTATAGTYLVNFPDGFKFPYFGTDRTALLAKTDGVIGFDTTYTTTTATNYAMPNTSYPKVDIAAFWDDLVAKTTGKFHYRLETGPSGRYLILQWSNFEFSSASYNPANLNFQAVLFETGDVELRYGTMTSSSTNPGYGNGQGATLGLQAFAGKWGQMVTTAHNTAVPGGLTGRSWRFGLAPSATGSTVVKPTESTTYRLCVTNASMYEVCQEIRVVVVKPGDLLISELMIAPTDPTGEWFELRNLSPDPIDLADFRITSGTTEAFAVPATPALVVPPGGYAVLARSASGAANGGLTPTLVYGDALTFTDVQDELALEFRASTIDRLLWSSAWTVPADGSIMLEPSKFDRDEAANNGSANWCAAPAVYGGSFKGNPGQLGPGCLGTGEHRYYLLDPVSGMPFLDIGFTGTALNDIWAEPYHSMPIPLPFAFPYFGDTVNEMYVTKWGAIALAPPSSLPTTNSAIPSASTQPNGLVGPMWENMHNAGTAAVLYQVQNVGGQQVMVVQWQDASISATNGLYGYATFQAQLWQNGDIVFAYKEPTKSTDPTYADYTYIYGSAATIGLENLAGDLAFQIYYGSASTGTVKPCYGGRAYHFRKK